MTIISEHVDKTLVLKLEGRLDSITASDLENAIKNESEYVNIIMDFEKLDYISSAGLRVLLATQKSVSSSNGSLKLIHVSDVIMEVFDITGFSDILTIE